MSAVRRALMVAAAAGLAAPALGQIVIADSVADFGITQGEAGWFYGFYDRDADPEAAYDAATDFQLMQASFLSGSLNYGDLYRPVWQVADSTYWAALFANGTVPNGAVTSGRRTARELWTVRRWVADATGDVEITGLLAKQFQTGGTGFVGSVFVDGVPLWSSYVAGDDFVGEAFGLSTTIVPGTTIDFVLDPFEGSDHSDHVLFTGRVTLIPTAPTAALLGLGGLAAVRRRR